MADLTCREVLWIGAVASEAHIHCVAGTTLGNLVPCGWMTRNARPSGISRSSMVHPQTIHNRSERESVGMARDTSRRIDVGIPRKAPESNGRKGHVDHGDSTAQNAESGWV